MNALRILRAESHEPSRGRGGLVGGLFDAFEEETQPRFPIPVPPHGLEQLVVAGAVSFNNDSTRQRRRGGMSTPPMRGVIGHRPAPPRPLRHLRGASILQVISTADIREKASNSVSAGGKIEIHRSCWIIGADGGGRTHTTVRSQDFESSASANSATSAPLWGHATKGRRRHASVPCGASEVSRRDGTRFRRTGAAPNLFVTRRGQRGLNRRRPRPTLSSSG